jgi:hypothetical protein
MRNYVDTLSEKLGRIAHWPPAEGPIGSILPKCSSGLALVSPAVFYDQSSCLHASLVSGNGDDCHVLVPRERINGVHGTLYVIARSEQQST